MPRIRELNRHLVEQIREQLVSRLASELIEGDQEDGPVIFEIPVHGTDTFHVDVIWNAWKGILPDDRSSIILSAYEKLDEGKDSGEKMAARITLAIGATGDEAIKYNLLPYTLMSSLDPRDPRFAQIRPALERAGAFESSTGIKLRFPTLQIATAACQTLNQLTAATMPDVDWRISQDVSRIDDE